MYRPKPLASLSLDLDNKWSYLKTHGDAGWDRYPTSLTLAVPPVRAFPALPRPPGPRLLLPDRPPDARAARRAQTALRHPRRGLSSAEAVPVADAGGATTGNPGDYAAGPARADPRQLPALPESLPAAAGV